MPCGAGGNGWTHDSTLSNEKKIELSELSNNIEIQKLKEKNKFLEAGLCALITELEKLDFFNEFMTKASENGKIDLFNFWDNHKKQDENRLRRELQRFSKHEIDVLKKLLNDGNPNN